MSKKTKCEHKDNSCKHCSRVKMVVYLKNSDCKVWYSFIKEDNQLAGLDAIASKMGDRVFKKYGDQLNKMLFYDNADPSQKPFLEN